MLCISHIQEAKKGLLIHNVSGVGRDKEETKEIKERLLFYYKIH